MRTPEQALWRSPRRGHQRTHRIQTSIPHLAPRRRLHVAARQSEGGTHPAYTSESMGPIEGFKSEENEEEKVNIGEDDSGDGTNSTSNGGYEFGVNPNDNPVLAQALRESMEEQRARQQAMARGTYPNNDPELTRALRASMEE